MSRRRPEWYFCEECNAPVFRRRKYGQPVRCYECVANTIAKAANEMVAKSGPAWDKWIASNADGAPGRHTTPER